MGVCPSRIEPIESGVTNLHTRCEANDKGIRKQEKNLSKLKIRLDATEQEINERVQKDMTAVRNRLEDMEQNFVKQIVHVRERLDGAEDAIKGIDANKKAINKLDINLKMVEEDVVKKIVHDMTTVRARICELEKNLIDQIMDIRADVGNLESWQFKVDKKLKG